MWKMTVKNVRTNKCWDEPLSILDKNYRSKSLPTRTDHEEVKEIAIGTVDFFNKTLRENESPRELVAVFLENKNGTKDIIEKGAI